MKNPDLGGNVSGDDSTPNTDSASILSASTIEMDFDRSASTSLSGSGGSRMSHLKLYQPSGETQTLRFDSPQPNILSFHVSKKKSSSATMTVLHRAKLLHDNRVCPHCSHPIVEPLELEDAVMNSSQMPIPGTATLVGFHCHGCGEEWPA